MASKPHLELAKLENCRHPVGRAGSSVMATTSLIMLVALCILSPGFGAQEEQQGAGRTTVEPRAVSDESAASKPRDLIVGRVVDAEGQGIAGADVWVFDPMTPGKKILAQTNTEPKGDFRLRLVDRESMSASSMIVVHKQGYSFTTHRIKTPESNEAASLELRLEPATDTSFVVLDPQGKPIPDARIEPGYVRTDAGFMMLPVPVRRNLQAVTDERGRALLSAVQRKGFLTVRVDSDQYGIQEQRLDESGEGPAERSVQLRGVGQLQGRLVAADSRWAAGVRLRFGTSTRTGSVLDETEGNAEITTDQEGRFSVPALAVGEVRIWESLDKKLPVRAQLPERGSVFVVEGQSTRLDITLVPTVAVRGRVVVQGSGEGVVGARVSLNYGSNQSDDAFTGADGRYEARIPPGEGYLRVMVIPPKYNAVQIGNIAADPFEVPATDHVVDLPVIELVPLVSREAKLVDESGEPVGGASVMAIFQNRVYSNRPTDAAGRFIFRLPKGLEPEKYQIWRDRDYVKLEVVTQTPLLFQVVALPEPEEITEDTRRLVTLSGRVLLNKRPLPNARVRLVRRERLPGGRVRYTGGALATTNNRGKYQLHDVRVGDSYRVELVSPGDAMDPTWNLNSLRQVSEAAGDVVSVPDMCLVKANQTLAGVCIDANGNPLSGIDIVPELRDSTRLAHNPNGPPYRAETDASGGFRITQLPDVPLSLRAYVSGTRADRRSRSMARVDCEKNDQAIEIRLDVSGPTGSSGFHKTIQQIAAARKRITAYEMTVTGKVHNTLERVHLTDGSVREVERTPIALTLKMLYDRQQSKFLVARQVVYRRLDTGKEETGPWRVFGRTMGPLQPERRVSAACFIGEHLPYFDPLGLGLCFGGEFVAGDRWERIIGNYMEWDDDFRVQVLADGQVYFANNEHRYLIDTGRGCWPISMNSRTGDTVLIDASMELAKVSGIWLPDTAEVRQPDETQQLKFQWHSVNQPIPEERFTAEDINARYGLSLRGR